MNDEDKPLGGEGATPNDNPWDLRLLTHWDLPKGCAVVFLAAFGFFVLNFWPRHFDTGLFPLYATESYQSGWPLVAYELNLNDPRDEEAQRDRPDKHVYHRVGMAVNVFVAALMIASLPAIRTFNIFVDDKPWGVRDMLILLTGTTAFVFATFRSICPCFWLPVVFAVPTFYSAPAAVILLASWGWRRLVPNNDIEA